MAKKIRTAEPQQKFTGSYKKKECILIITETLSFRMVVNTFRFERRSLCVIEPKLNAIVESQQSKWRLF